MKVPVFVGLPEIFPVDFESFKPSGSVPEEIDQVIGVVPEALRVKL